MKSQNQPPSIRLIIFWSLSAVLGGALTLVGLSPSINQQTTIFDKIFTAIILWIMSTFMMSALLMFLAFLFLSRKRIFQFFRNPYPWWVSLIMVVLSGLPWLILTFLYWTEVGFWFLRLYGMVCFVPILVTGWLAAAFLSPRLTVTTTIKLRIGSGLVWLGFILFSAWFYAIFFEPYVFVYPSRDEWLNSLYSYWMAFLGVWVVWSAWLRLKDLLPARIREFIDKINIYHPSPYFIFVSVPIALIYPLMLMLTESYYGKILAFYGVWFKFTEFDKMAWRTFVSVVPIIAGIAFFVFLIFSTIRLITQPALARKITNNPASSGLIAVLWLFTLWWIYFASLATLINFITPGEYAFTINSNQAPTFYDFFFYVFGVITTSDLGDIKAIGNGARWVSIWMTLTGIVLLIPLGEVIGSTFIKKLFNPEEEQDSQ